ncbi:MAG: HAMP domain-containing histidine kinase [Deltaproteobacteria bacterium]|nr:HAMP domain-containing histidine kinase [Deltaproteobacteria bacterium]
MRSTSSSPSTVRRSRVIETSGPEVLADVSASNKEPSCNAKRDRGAWFSLTGACTYGGELRVRVARDGLMVSIEIGDTGIGMDARQRARAVTATPLTAMVT